MEWIKNLLKKKPTLHSTKDLEWQRKFDEEYGERMKKPGILSSACPSCGRTWGWLNIKHEIEITRKTESSMIPELDLFDYRWICLNCLHIWVDSEHEDPNGWWHTHNSKAEHLQSSFQKVNKDDS